MSGERRHDVVVFGATGFTGRLVCEHLRERGHGCRSAIAERNRSKLEAVHAELGLADDVGIVVADSDDQASLDAMAADTRVLCTTAGPYQWYGSGVVAACAVHGTDHVDLAGETPWMKDMIEAHHDAAVGSGARIESHVVEVEVAADLDPGYGSTAKIIGEAGLCLLDTSGPGGCTTPAVAMGADLIDALRKYAGVRIQVQEDS